MVNRFHKQFEYDLIDSLKSANLIKYIFSAPNSEDAACVDLDGDWSEQSKVFRYWHFLGFKYWTYKMI